jgi:hypothetical protein
MSFYQRPNTRHRSLADKAKPRTHHLCNTAPANAHLSAKCCLAKIWTKPHRFPLQERGHVVVKIFRSSDSSRRRRPDDASGTSEPLPFRVVLVFELLHVLVRILLPVRNIRADNHMWELNHNALISLHLFPEWASLFCWKKNCYPCSAKCNWSSFDWLKMSGWQNDLRTL